MYTDRLINLFGGDDETIKKKSNTTLIIVIIIIIVCCLLFSSGAFMMYKKNNDKKQDKLDNKKDNKEENKEDNKKDNKEESDIDHCEKYNDDSIDYSDECMEQLFKNVGCTTNYKDTFKPKFDESISKSENKPPFGLIKKGIKMMLTMDDVGKKVCYGPDKSKWPVEKPTYSGECSPYNDYSKDISDNCIQQLWREAGCTTKYTKDPGDKSTGIPLSMYKIGFSMQSKQGYDSTRTKCYGSDKSKWPEVCSGYVDNDTFIDNVCIDKMWKDAGCTQPTSLSINGEQTKKEIQNNINNIAKSTDPDVKSKCF